MTAEITVQSLDAQQARSLTDRIRGSLATAHDGLIEAYQGRAWEALDYDSWDTYCASEFSGARMVRLEQAQRRELGVSMRAAGMSTRAIGSGLGIDEKTVRNDLSTAEYSAVETITGVNGKTYQPHDPGRGARLIHLTGEIVDAEVVDAEIVDAEIVDTPRTSALRAPRTDVVATVNAALMRARDAAAAARNITSVHLATRATEASVWLKDLDASLDALSTFHAQLERACE